MRFLLVLSVLIGLGMMTVYGCGSGGSDGGTPAVVTASMSTSVSGGQAVCKLTVSGVSSTLCGFEVNLGYPSNSTFVSAVPTGVASNGLIVANPLGNTLKTALISGTGFSSGEVATITFNVAGDVQSSDFSISGFDPEICP